MMFWYGDDMGGWGYAGMAIGMFLFWALVLGGIVALIRVAAGDQRFGYSGPAEPDARQILAARYAHGDITETEYRERLAVLREHAPT
ncbi:MULTISPECIES: SHOCT domain-containing protein [unclassified Mycobacterium]|uniref:SHOCT domain-containing protein n=1 Tax=unclassified Mycobacterium TaxID=2642494 RepID=UPI00048AE0F1|nr:MULTISPECIES: SHOCT domain-containing protein [unclassified Mycobacterium]SEA90312.1 putative membrane protein [Mycobacterium sp. 283mftsu]